MKNLLFILALVSLTLSSCVCHNFGEKGGVNLASINGDNT